VTKRFLQHPVYNLFDGLGLFPEVTVRTERIARSGLRRRAAEHSDQRIRVRKPRCVKTSIRVTLPRSPAFSARPIRSTIRSDDAYPPLGGQAQPRGWETRKVLEEIGLRDSDIEDLLATGAAVAT